LNKCNNFTSISVKNWNFCVKWWTLLINICANLTFQADCCRVLTKTAFSVYTCIWQGWWL